MFLDKKCHTAIACKKENICPENILIRSKIVYRRVSEANAYQWWDDHRMMLKNIHTDCRNNKIKMLKQQFNGKFSR